MIYPKFLNYFLFSTTTSVNSFLFWLFYISSEVQVQTCKSHINALNGLSEKNGKRNKYTKNLVTIDVHTIYTNIYPEEGALQNYNKLEERKNKTIPLKLLKKTHLNCTTKKCFQVSKFNSFTDKKTARRTLITSNQACSSVKLLTNITSNRVWFDFDLLIIFHLFPSEICWRSHHFKKCGIWYKIWNR